MKLAFAEPRRRLSRVYTREALLDWCGPPWVPPEDPCPRCHGTGTRTGSTLAQQRPGLLRPGVYLDRNLLAQLLQAFPVGAVIVDADNKRASRDPIRLRSVDGDTRAALARMTGATEGLTTFEELDARQPGTLALGAPHGPSEPRKGPPTPQAVSEPGERPSVRRVGGRADFACPHCGEPSGGDVCEHCGKGQVGT